MKYLISLCLSQVLWLSCAYGQPEQSTGVSYASEAQKLHEMAIAIRFQYPDSAITLLRRSYEGYINSQDTVEAINALVELAQIYGHQANYSLAYDGFWKALFLADESQNEPMKALVYMYIGRLYSYYKRKKEALVYFQISLNINKQLVAAGELEESDLIQNYQAFCSTYRELDDPIRAKAYLDSCFLYYSQTTRHQQAHLLFEKAFTLAKNERSEEALEVMHTIRPWFEKNVPSYLVLFYSYLGDIYKDLSEIAESEKYYNEALRISELYHSHRDFTPLVYEKLSHLYLIKNDYPKAFENLQTAKTLDSKFFDARSENNRPLLEIKDAFRLEKERREAMVQQQRLTQLEHEDQVWFLQKIILLVVIGSLIIVGVAYFSYFKSKHRSEKNLMRREQDLERRKNEELLELKNKELATSALQLVEKDELLGLLKEKLKSNGNGIQNSELKQIFKSISVSNARSWKEFRLRFTAVNERFYQELTQKYPGLSQGDQKICALIKLNFSSKDMARLLGISVESVHTTRYRLRKKLGLQRKNNLEDFIGAL